AASRKRRRSPSRWLRAADGLYGLDYEPGLHTRSRSGRIGATRASVNPDVFDSIYRPGELRPSQLHCPFDLERHELALRHVHVQHEVVVASLGIEVVRVLDGDSLAAKEGAKHIIVQRHRHESAGSRS